MKFHWFAEVTYPHLPDGFADTYPSAWVDVPPELHDPAEAGETLRMFYRMLKHADQVGFDGLAVNEHHQNAGAMTPSPNLLAAALAPVTERAALLVIGDSLALYNPPLRVAGARLARLPLRRSRDRRVRLGNHHGLRIFLWHPAHRARSLGRPGRPLDARGVAAANHAGAVRQLASAIERHSRPDAA